MIFLPFYCYLQNSAIHALSSATVHIHISVLEYHSNILLSYSVLTSGRLELGSNEASLTCMNKDHPARYRTDLLSWTLRH